MYINAILTGFTGVKDMDRFRHNAVSGFVGSRMILLSGF